LTQQRREKEEKKKTEKRQEKTKERQALGERKTQRTEGVSFLHPCIPVRSGR
jgi:hypothetical protein